MQTKLLYPRIWQSLYSFGLNQSHTTIMGVIIIASFLVGICLVLPNVSNKVVITVFAAVLSPATILGAERASLDLLMFFIAALSIVAVQRLHLLSGLIILCGFTLKLFPIFGWFVLFRVEKSKFIITTLIALAIVSIYTAMNYSDILHIWKEVPRGLHISYGVNVLSAAVSKVSSELELIVKVLSYLVVLLIFVFALIDPFRNQSSSEQQNDTIHLDAFRAGSSVFIGSFLLFGNSWDYRLVFLIFALPQLLLWTEQSTNISIISKLTITTIFISLWSLVIFKLFNYLPYGKYISFFLDEISNWLTFSGLVYLIIWSLPEWGKSLIKKPFHKKVRSPK